MMDDTIEDWWLYFWRSRRFHSWSFPVIIGGSTAMVVHESQWCSLASGNILYSDTWYVILYACVSLYCIEMPNNVMLLNIAATTMVNYYSAQYIIHHIYMSIQSNYYILVVAWYHWSNMTVLHYNDNHQPPPCRSASSVYLQGLGINWLSQPMSGVWVCFKCQNPADVEAFVNCLYLLTTMIYVYNIHKY